MGENLGKLVTSWHLKKHSSTFKKSIFLVKYWQIMISPRLSLKTFVFFHDATMVPNDWWKNLKTAGDKTVKKWSEQIE